ncbi:MAG: hypothetical protein K6F87_03090 [Lachnospiraceae bacterium]|nr:hypothetical protein [Lachnospiraceae bacterium]
MKTYKEDRYYKDFYNFQDESFDVDLTVNAMLFSNGLLTIPNKEVKTYVWNWDIAPHDYKDKKRKELVEDRSHGLVESDDREEADRLSQITGDVIYEGRTYEYGLKRVYAKNTIDVTAPVQVSNTVISADDEVNVDDWSKDVIHNTKRIDIYEQVLITLSDEVLCDLEKVFTATLFFNRMNEGGKKGFKELIKAKLTYSVKEQQPRLDMEIKECVPYEGTIDVNGCSVDAGLCRAIERKFRDAHIVSGAVLAKENEVRWKPPFDWIDVPKKEGNEDKYDEDGIKTLFQRFEQLRAINAVYMWVGHKKSKNAEKYLYIGIVGVRENGDNTVGKRILEQEKKGIAGENGIIIDRFRFSEIESCGKNVSVDEALQTVEMQCINNFSAFFEYAESSRPKEEIIHNLFSGVVMENESVSTMRLLNNKKRYHNDGRAE